jgi:hypothetical protein
LADFSKEFYHWLIDGYNEAQRRDKITLVTLFPLYLQVIIILSK